MTLNIQIFNAVVETAKSRASNNPRWIAAISKAADAIQNGKWIITELFDGIMITTESGETYRAGSECQCKAFQFGQPCRHRALSRLFDLYRETAAPTISRTIECDRTGVRYTVVRCNGWAV